MKPLSAMKQRRCAPLFRYMSVLALCLCPLMVAPQVFSQQPSQDSGAEPGAGSGGESGGQQASAPLGDFVHIPAGTFVMGSNPSTDPMAFENERWSEQRLQGRVEVPDFYIGRFEVTVGQFQAFVEATGYATQASFEVPAALPMVNVSWTDALAYSRWLTKNLKQDPEAPAQLRQLLQEGWIITLPNEAQWEKAARGFGSRIYPWGNQPLKDRANFDSDSLRPVGSFDCPECAYGLADMAGNVWELTRSPFQPYPFDATPFDSASLDSRDGSINFDEDPLWVMRGGSFTDPANLVRGAVRGGIDPAARRPNIGFRLVLTRD